MLDYFVIEKISPNFALRILPPASGRINFCSFKHQCNADRNYWKKNRND